jgi:hypothetical protein
MKFLLGTRIGDGKLEKEEICCPLRGDGLRELK